MTLTQMEAHMAALAVLIEALKAIAHDEIPGLALGYKTREFAQNALDEWDKARAVTPAAPAPPAFGTSPVDRTALSFWAADIVNRLESEQNDSSVLESVDMVIDAVGQGFPPGTKYNNLCLASARRDEPLFVTRSQDATAQQVVLSWLVLNSHIKPGPNRQYTRKFQAALALIEAMGHWQQSNSTKSAD